MTDSNVHQIAFQGQATAAPPSRSVTEIPPQRDGQFAAGWEAFYEAHHGRAYDFASRLLNNPHDAEDVTQEAFWRAFKWWGTTPSPSRQWLFTIISHLIADRGRRRRIVKFLSFEWWFTWAGPDAEWEHDYQALKSLDRSTDDTEGETLTAETQLEVRRVLASLPHKDAVCLTLQAYDDFTYDEIAAVLGTTRKGVKSRMWRARNKFFVEANRLGLWATWTNERRPIEAFA